MIPNFFRKYGLANGFMFLCFHALTSGIFGTKSFIATLFSVLAASKGCKKRVRLASISKLLGRYQQNHLLILR
jgi:hypothetical protein